MVYDYYQNPYNEQKPVAVLGNMLSDQIGSIRNAKQSKSGEKTGKEKVGTGEAGKSIGDTNKRYKKGCPKGGNPKEDKLIRKDTAKIKSESFKEFLDSIGETVSKWKKIMETWETLEGEVYERHYWTDGINSYYHD